MLNNKTALIAGASSGIGRATPLRFPRSIPSVVLADTDTEGANHIRVEVKKNVGQRIPDARKLYVKYMVCLRCIMMVKEELRKLGMQYVAVELGMIEMLETITEDQREQLKKNLWKLGLELMDDKKAILIEKIKLVIMEMIHHSDELPRENYSDIISKKVGYDYTYLAHIFSEVKGITIQQFIIAHKIERVKELLLYGELNLTEISYKLNYSSVAHLSNQFKKTTGLTPSFYKQMKEKRQVSLESL